MTKLFRMTSLAATVAAVALTATPAFAADPDVQARAHARIVKPLTLEWVQDLNLGTIVLSGAGAWTGAVVSVDQNGGFLCTNANVTCSGTTAEARYLLNGTNQQDVDITVSSTINLANQTDNTQPDLVLNVDAPSVVTLPNSGTSGVEFGVGGSITIDSTTADGVYEGVFDLTAEYQG